MKPAVHPFRFVAAAAVLALSFGFAANASAAGLTLAPASVPAVNQSATPPTAMPQTAAVDTASASSSVADQLAQVQAQIPLLKAQAEVAKLKQEIANPGGKVNAGDQPGVIRPAMGEPAMTASYRPSVVSKPADARPTVLWIAGYDGHMDAQLKLAGRSIHVREGSEFGSGYRVVSITSKEVVVARGKSTLSLRP